MTLQDLYKSVSQLGFEDSLGDDSTERFIYATNRALVEINSLRPRCRRVDINHRAPKNLLFSEPKQIEKTETMTFTARNAKSFYFEVAGEGRFFVGLKKTNGDVANATTYTTFNSKTFISQRGFIKYDGAFIDSLMKNSEDYTGEAVIVFEGEYNYTIRNLAMYDQVYSSDVNDIMPYGFKVAYDITTLVSDFERFDSPPIDFLGNRLHEDYTIEENLLYLPIDKPGTYTVNYLHKVKPIPLSADVSASATEIVTIDLEDDLVTLLPNLIAAYVWLDDEADKSQYYYNLYLQRAEQIKRNKKNYNPVEFESVYGW